MRSLIIGMGEIGKSLHYVLERAHESNTRDLQDSGYKDIEVLNICYPYSKKFVEITKGYIRQYRPDVTIIHSTVPPGTTRKCGSDVVHSPIHGKHPNLSKGILTFTKYIGGSSRDAVKIAEAFLKKAGIKTKVVKSSETSELSKVFCTTQYGWNILLMREIYAQCKKFKVPFDQVYTEWNQEYNAGYAKLEMPQFTRPVLKYMPGKIGGHCVVNNCNLVKSFVTGTIKRKNKEYTK